MRGMCTCPLGHTTNAKMIIVTYVVGYDAALWICEECGVVFSIGREKSPKTLEKEYLKKKEEEEPKSPTDPEIIREELDQ